MTQRLRATRRTWQPRRALAGILLALAAAGLAGCQAIPVAGPVHVGLADLDQADRPVQFNPGGPVQGASQEEIVRGFVRAATSNANDYEIAREFLTPAYADQWNPAAEIFVDEGTQPFRSVDATVGELSLWGLAVVDERGTLTPLEAGPATVMRFEFEQVRGEWRIVSAPNGIILDRSTFAALWVARNLYFLSGDGRLAAETRWFLNRPTLATQVVGELLAGPEVANAQAFRTAFPAGTLLQSAVPVREGVARIELSPELLNGDPITMEQAKLQLSASLQALAGVTRFEIIVNGAVIDGGSVAVPDSDARAPELNQAVVFVEDQFGTLSTGSAEVESLSRISDRVAALDPLGAAVASDHSSAAVRHRAPDGSGTSATGSDSGSGSGSGASRGTGGVVTWVSGSAIVALDLRDGLHDPGIDRFGFVWSYASSEPDRILVERPGEEGIMLSLPGLGNRAPVAVRISPSGNRIAMMVDVNTAAGDEAGAGSGTGSGAVTSVAPSQGTVIVASVVRDAAGRPVVISETTTNAMWLSGGLIDFDWVDELRLVTLSQAGTGAKVTIGPLGQLPSEAGTVSNAVAVSGGGGRTLIRVLNQEQRLYGPQGAGWQRLADDVDFVAR